MRGGAAASTSTSGERPAAGSSTVPPSTTCRSTPAARSTAPWRKTASSVSTGRTFPRPAPPGLGCAGRGSLARTNCVLRCEDAGDAGDGAGRGAPAAPPLPGAAASPGAPRYPPALGGLGPAELPSPHRAACSPRPSPVCLPRAEAHLSPPLSAGDG